jgi:hypothetical protein
MHEPALKIDLPVLSAVSKSKGRRVRNDAAAFAVRARLFSTVSRETVENIMGLYQKFPCKKCYTKSHPVNPQSAPVFFALSDEKIPRR